MIILYIIIALAFLLRISGLFFGLPLDVYGDEIAHTIIAFKVINAKSLFIPFAGEAFLPPLFAYILAPFFLLTGGLGMISGFFSGVADFKDFVILNKELFLPFGRIISALFGTATVYFLYVFAEKIFNKRVASLSAFFLAISFLHIHESQIGHIWSPITFFFVVGAYFCYMLYSYGDRKWYYLSALSAGLGYAIGQIPILIFILLAVSHFFRVKKTGERFWNRDFKRASIAVFLVFLIFTALNPYTFYKHSIEPIGIILKIFGIKLDSAYSVSSVVSKTSTFGSLAMASKMFFFIDPILLVLGILGMLFFLKRNINFNSIALLAFPVFYLAFMVIFTNFTYRYVLPAIPFLVIFSAYFVFFIYDKIPDSKYKKILFPLIIIIISSYSFVSSVFYSAKLLRPYTVSEGVNWMYANVSDGSRIVSDVYLNSNKESIKFLEENNIYGWMDAKKLRLLNMDENGYPKPNYFLIDLNLTDAFSIHQEEKFAGYFLISFYNSKEESEKKEILDSFRGEKEMIAKFYPKTEKENVKSVLNFEPQLVVKSIIEQDHMGPYVEIYKTIKQ